MIICDRCKNQTLYQMDSPPCLRMIRNKTAKQMNITRTFKVDICPKCTSIMGAQHFKMKMENLHAMFVNQYMRYQNMMRHINMPSTVCNSEAEMRKLLLKNAPLPAYRTVTSPAPSPSPAPETTDADAAMYALALNMARSSHSVAPTQSTLSTSPTTTRKILVTNNNVFVRDKTRSANVFLNTSDSDEEGGDTGDLYDPADEDEDEEVEEDEEDEEELYD